MEYNAVIDNALLMVIVISCSFFSYYFAAIRTDKKVKELEDKVWEYMKVLNRTEPANTKSGMTRKLK